MNPTEKKYLKERIQQIKNEKEGIIREEHKVDEVDFYLKHLKRIKAADMITVIEEKLDKIYINYNGYVPEITISSETLFINIEKVRESFKDRKEKENEVREGRFMKLNSHVEELLDEIMLGDSSEALKHLQAFNIMKF